MVKNSLAGAGFVALVTVTLLATSGTSEGGPFGLRGRRFRNTDYYPDSTVVYTDTTIYQPTYYQPYYPNEGRTRLGILRRNRTPAYNNSMAFYNNSMPFTYVSAGSDTVTYSTSGYRPGDVTNAPGSEMPARLRIAIPSERADIWIEGEKSEQSRRVQDYASPPLASGKQYYYEVRARWTDASGKQIERTKSFPIVPGQPVFLDFTRVSTSDKEQIPAPKDEKPIKNKNKED